MSGKSIAEDFFEADGLYRTESLEIVRIDILDVAEDAVSIFAVLDPFFLDCLDIFESHVLHGFVLR